MNTRHLSVILLTLASLVLLAPSGVRIGRAVLPEGLDLLALVVLLGVGIVVGRRK